MKSNFFRSIMTCPNDRYQKINNLYRKFELLMMYLKKYKVFSHENCLKWRHFPEMGVSLKLVFTFYSGL